MEDELREIFREGLGKYSEYPIVKCGHVQHEWVITPHTNVRFTNYTQILIKSLSFSGSTTAMSSFNAHRTHLIKKAVTELAMDFEWAIDNNPKEGQWGTDDTPDSRLMKGLTPGDVVHSIALMRGPMVIELAKTGDSQDYMIVVEGTYEYRVGCDEDWKRDFPEMSWEDYVQMLLMQRKMGV